MSGWRGKSGLVKNRVDRVSSRQRFSPLTDVRSPSPAFLLYKETKCKLRLRECRLLSFFFSFPFSKIKPKSRENREQRKQKQRSFNSISLSFSFSFFHSFTSAALLCRRFEKGEEAEARIYFLSSQSGHPGFCFCEVLG